MVILKTSYLIGALAASAAGVAAPSVAPEMVLHAFGVTVPGTMFLAGLCFAISGGFVAMAMTPPAGKAGKWATLAVAILIGILACILHPFIPVVRELPVQAVMGIAGLGSRKAVDRVRNHDLSLPWRDK